MTREDAVTRRDRLALLAAGLAVVLSPGTAPAPPPPEPPPAMEYKNGRWQPVRRPPNQTDPATFLTAAAVLVPTGLGMWWWGRRAGRRGTRPRTAGLVGAAVGAAAGAAVFALVGFPGQLPPAVGGSLLIVAAAVSAAGTAWNAARDATAPTPT